MENQDELDAIKLKNMNCLCKKLEPNENFSKLLDIIQSSPDLYSPKNLIIAFDFDQTIKDINEQKKIVIRGGEDSLKTLLKLHELKYLTYIVTAAPPTIPSVNTIVNEVRELGLENVFKVKEFQKNEILNCIEKWGANEKLEMDLIEKKLILLISLFTDRLPSDLCRIGFSNCKIGENQIQYRLLKGENWGALLTVKANEKNALLCPFQCWKEFQNRKKNIFINRKRIVTRTNKII